MQIVTLVAFALKLSPSSTDREVMMNLYHRKLMMDILAIIGGICICASFLLSVAGSIWLHTSDIGTYESRLEQMQPVYLAEAGLIVGGILLFLATALLWRKRD